MSALVNQTSFCGGSSGDLAKRRLFSQAKSNVKMRLTALGVYFILGAQGRARIRDRARLVSHVDITIH